MTPWRQVKRVGQEMLITGQIEHKYERGKRKGGGRRKEYIERGNIMHGREGAEGRRRQKGTRGANVKGAEGEKIKKGRRRC